ncbi:D-arabinono-1,4-lactone oxidase [Erwinia sp. B116]|uniref:D-arabinono-1,4-lactone oxidase n=1 Tax=Erwinia sp. B116 TaxID=1561024 RepID=UPI000C76058C|nr:D-arabinono-1,4-lactone oxidase [Erwinia sp. B116]PLV55970.1 metal chaperone, involved in Zn homeostasis, GTPase of family protein [Erwinia sp. B116]
MTQERYPRRQPQLPESPSRQWNWAQNATLAHISQIDYPASEAELQALLCASHGRVRIMGSRMSPGRMLALADAGDRLIDTSQLRGLLASNEQSATFAGGTPLHEVYEVLTGMNRMLPASPGVIAAQTLAGALATGTHGQGLQQSTIGDEVLAIRMVLADGSIAEFDRQHADFPAVQLGLGCLGAVTAVTLRTCPLGIYTCHKSAVSADSLAEDLLTWNQDYALSKAWWFPGENQVHLWAAREATDEERENYRLNGDDLLKYHETNDAMNQTVDRTLEHMRSDTQITDENGKPFRTVTRFKDFTDVTGDIYQVFCRGIATPQINVEIAIPLERAPAVIERIKRWHADEQPHMHYPVILRCTGASESWLSPAYQQASCFFGFVVYYAEDGSLSEEGLAFITAVEKLLAEEGGRPHWGKYFDASLYNWDRIYPQLAAFRAVRERLDPQHRFSNTFSQQLLKEATA